MVKKNMKICLADAPAGSVVMWRKLPRLVDNGKAMVCLKNGHVSEPLATCTNVIPLLKSDYIKL